VVIRLEAKMLNIKINCQTFILRPFAVDSMFIQWFTRQRNLIKVLIKKLMNRYEDFYVRIFMWGKGRLDSGRIKKNCQA
jgi:hypothetical protein